MGQLQLNIFYLMYAVKKFNFYHGKAFPRLTLLQKFKAKE